MLNLLKNNEIIYWDLRDQILNDYRFTCIHNSKDEAYRQSKNIIDNIVWLKGFIKLRLLNILWIEHIR